MSILNHNPLSAASSSELSSLRFDQLDDFLPGGNAASETSKNIMKQLIAADYTDYAKKYPQFPTRIDFSSYDRIELTADQGQKLVEICQNLSNSTVVELFKAPTLPEFAIHIEAPNVSVTTCYKPSIVPASIFSLACHDCGSPCQPYVDAYLSSNEDLTDIVFAIGVNTKTLDTAVTICHLESDLNFASANHIAIYTSRLYIAIQYLMRERPHAIVQRSRRVIDSPAPRRKKSKNHKPRKVHYVRTLYLGDDLHGLKPQGHHASPSGSFGVSGHWRHYKNGKRVWVRPYIKGASNNDAYIPKEYECPTKSPNSTDSSNFDNPVPQKT